MIYTISNTSSNFSIDTNGARISLVLNGKQILVPLDNRRNDNKVGSTHPCTPNFGPFGSEYGLPQHGPARLSSWDLVSKIENSKGGAIELKFQIENPPYPSGVSIIQKFELIDDSFEIKTTHINNAKVTAPIVFGEHFYWSSPNGWVDVLLNNSKISDLIKKDSLINIPTVNKLVIPNYVTLTINCINMPFAKLWSRKSNDNDIWDNHYFCFEPVSHDEKDFGNSNTLLNPNSKIESKIIVEVI